VKEKMRHEAFTPSFYHTKRPPPNRSENQDMERKLSTFSKKTISFIRNIEKLSD